MVPSCVRVRVCVFSSERERESSCVGSATISVDVGDIRPDAKIQNCLAFVDVVHFPETCNGNTRPSGRLGLLCSNYCCADLENSPRMIVRAVGKAETRPFTHSRSLEKPLKGCYNQCRLQACNDGVLCIYSGQITLQRITRSSKLSSTKVKRTNHHFAAKVKHVKATKFASASTRQVRRLRTCTMMYNV